MKAPLITVDNLCMDFDGQRVLKNISFEIAEGEILGIIGRSGAGKTVLMHLMRGVEPVSYTHLTLPTNREV